MDNYCENQAARMIKWIKLFLMMSSSQKFEVFRDCEKEAFYEGTVSEITFEDLTVFADDEPAEIAAKDGIFIISVETPDS